MLSGFVLALNYGRGFAEGWSIDVWCEFLLRRVARIFPLYFVCTVAGVTIVMFRDSAVAAELFKPTGQNPLTVGFANLLLVQSWGLGKSIDGTAWSLSAEWAAYLAFRSSSDLLCLAAEALRRCWRRFPRPQLCSRSFSLGSMAKFIVARSTRTMAGLASRCSAVSLGSLWACSPIASLRQTMDWRGVPATPNVA